MNSTTPEPEGVTIPPSFFRGLLYIVAAALGVLVLYLCVEIIRMLASALHL